MLSHPRDKEEHMALSRNEAFFKKIRPEMLVLAAQGDFCDRYSEEPIPELFYQWFLYQKNEPLKYHKYRISGTSEALSDLFNPDCRSYRSDRTTVSQVMREFNFIAYQAGMSCHAPLNDNDDDSFQLTVTALFEPLAHLFQCERCFKRLIRMSIPIL